MHSTSQHSYPEFIGVKTPPPSLYYGTGSLALSSPESIDVDQSCESLSTAFSQASLEGYFRVSNLDTLIGDEHATIAAAQDNELADPSPETILFYEILQEFPDLSSFICHSDFGVFASIWLELQRRAYLARNPANRPATQTWFKTTALQLHFMLVGIVKSNPNNYNIHSEARCMFSALRRLKDRIEILHQVFQVVENGRIMFGQSPLQAIAPLFKAADNLQQDLEYFDQNPDVLPVIDSHSDIIELRPPHQVSMSELNTRVIQTYNIMPYEDTTHTTDSPFPTPTTGLQQEGSSTPALYIQDDTYFSNLSQEQLAHYSSSMSHIPPSLMQNSSFSSPSAHYWSSLPVTPSLEHPEHRFLSLPASPTCTLELQSTNTSVVGAYTPCNTVRETSLSSPTCETLTSLSPLNTISESSSPEPYHSLEEEESSVSSQDEEYIQSDADDDDEWVEPSRQRNNNSNNRRKLQQSSLSVRSSTRQQTARRLSNKPLSGSTTTSTATTTAAPIGQRLHRATNKETRRLPSSSSGTVKARRTATSYDAQTTHYLKTIFFDIYSNRDKLSKEQRRQVQRRTGLKPRNITYWFSNHKRRFQTSLMVFKKVVEQSGGKVKTYDDFLVWRRKRGLPEEVMDNEIDGLEAIMELTKSEEDDEVDDKMDVSLS